MVGAQLYDNHAPTNKQLFNDLRLKSTHGAPLSQTLYIMNNDSSDSGTTNGTEQKQGRILIKMRP